MKFSICIFSFLFSGILISCDDQQKKQNENNIESNEPHQHREVLQGLQLNDGQKWKVDEPTNKIVTHMQQIVELYEIEKIKTLSGFVDVGKKLGNDINLLVENCKITGPHHDAFHEWFHPFMEETKSLIKAQNSEEAENFEGLDAMLHKYYEYFQQ